MGKLKKWLGLEDVTTPDEIVNLRQTESNIVITEVKDLLEDLRPKLDQLAEVLESAEEKAQAKAEPTKKGTETK